LVGAWFGRRELRSAGLVGARFARRRGGRRELRGGDLVGARRGVIAAVVRPRGTRCAFGRREAGVVGTSCEAGVW
jgi:hypothetical protein